jgi:DNA (cytosine-5)-methyltransferase 1
MSAYYNEIDSFPAQWLCNLIAANHITDGHVDRRDIKEVLPDDITGYNHAHFFAGIGVWSYALKLAGWPDDQSVWTGSCPCQPFSAAGKRGGTDDPRHLWPEWFRLIRECHPPVIFGEQVASKDGLAWLDIVYSDLESEGYAVAAFDLCAAGIGAPHIRQRLYFVADTLGERRRGWSNGYYSSQDGRSISQTQVERSEPTGFMADTKSQQMGNDGQSRKCTTTTNKLAHTDHTRLEGWQGMQYTIQVPLGQRSMESIWSNVEWIPCRDGKARPTQPGLFPLANGVTTRVGRLRAYGNAIVAPLAIEFIKAYIEGIRLED